MGPDTEKVLSIYEKAGAAQDRVSRRADRKRNHIARRARQRIERLVERLKDRLAGIHNVRRELAEQESQASEALWVAGTRLHELDLNITETEETD